MMTNKSCTGEYRAHTWPSASGRAIHSGIAGAIASVAMYAAPVAQRCDAVVGMRVGVVQPRIELGAQVIGFAPGFLSDDKCGNGAAKMKRRIEPDPNGPPIDVHSLYPPKFSTKLSEAETS